MNGYIVRLKDDGELVGFFVAGSIAHLRNSVDEACDPQFCEYKVIDSGGAAILWQEGGTPVIQDDPEEDDNLDGASMSDGFYMNVTDERRWVAL